MNFEGTCNLSNTRERIWEMLHDPNYLEQSIPGCKSLETTEDGQLEATVQLKIGPVKATFKGMVEFQDENYPESFRLAGEGKGGVAGFAKGFAIVTLTEEDDGQTLLGYSAESRIGGKLAQLGSRLIKSTTAKLTRQFFESFSKLT